MSVMFSIRVEAGPHARNDCPVSFKLPSDAMIGSSNEPVCMLDEQGTTVPVQIAWDGDSCVVHFIVNDLPERTSRTYELFSMPAPDSCSTIQLIERDGKTDVHIGGQFFTSYVYDPSVAKPYVGPVMSPFGDSYTRLDFETREHPHHRSMWLAIGEVNGIDLWNEPEGVYGKQVHQTFLEKQAGSVFAIISSRNAWTDFEGSPLVDEERTITVYNTSSERRFIDMDILFRAAYGEVRFGATKEAGPLGIRVAETVIVDRGGVMTNSYGAIGEQECWGKPAQWCDYCGSVGGRLLGIAAFDHPDNDDHPTCWHIRNYGLMAPNNLYFRGGRQLKRGETIRYRYRVYFHTGDTKQGKVAERYHDYVNPPKLTLT